MRRLALLSLIAYLSIVFSPFVMAEKCVDEEINGIKTCPTCFENTMGNYESYKTEIDNFNNETIKDSNQNCGSPNKNSNLLEKGDCTEEGKVITEVSELFGEDTSTGEGDSENEIKTVYKGSCCFAIDLDLETNEVVCKEVVEIYTETYSECTAAATGCQKRQWIIGTSGAGIIKVYVKQIYRWAALTVGSIAVVTMVISGIQISVSGVSGDITNAKNKMLSALAGIVLLFLSGLILYTINPTFFS